VETGVRKSRGSETNENSANVAVQIKTLIPVMISRVGTTALGPPSKIKTGKEVRTITELRRADLRRTLRRLGAGDSSSLPGTVTGFSGGGFISTPSGRDQVDRRFRTLSLKQALPIVHQPFRLHLPLIGERPPIISNSVIIDDD
jgi:hypothetical protein